MKAKAIKPKEIELHPDAWERFGRFVRDIAKAGPQHRKAKPKAEGAKSLKKKRR
jgi:hypothetical protein